MWTIEISQKLIGCLIYMKYPILQNMGELVTFKNHHLQAFSRDNPRSYSTIAQDMIYYALLIVDKRKTFQSTHVSLLCDCITILFQKNWFLFFTRGHSRSCPALFYLNTKRIQNYKTLRVLLHFNCSLLCWYTHTVFLFSFTVVPFL